MKQKNLLIVLLLISAGFFSTVHAQAYRNAFGVRLGYDNGLTLKHFASPSSAFEGILSASPRYFQLTGLYEYQQPFQGAPGLDWFVGFGAHLGSVYYKDYKGSRAMIGGDLIAGLEYVFPSAPFNVTLDWKPTFNFSNDYNDYWFAGLALSLRYTFGR